MLELCKRAPVLAIGGGRRGGLREQADRDEGGEAHASKMPDQPCFMPAIRRSISSFDTCSTTAQIVHLLPPRSFTVALR